MLGKIAKFRENYAPPTEAQTRAWRASYLLGAAERLERQAAQLLDQAKQYRATSEALSAGQRQSEGAQ